MNRFRHPSVTLGIIPKIAPKSLSRAPLVASNGKNNASFLDKLNHAKTYVPINSMSFIYLGTFKAIACLLSHLIVDKVAGHQGYRHVDSFDGKTLAREQTDVAQIFFLTNYVNHRIKSAFEIFWLWKGKNTFLLNVCVKLYYLHCELGWGEGIAQWIHLRLPSCSPRF